MMYCIDPIQQWLPPYVALHALLSSATRQPILVCLTAAALLVATGRALNADGCSSLRPDAVVNTSAAGNTPLWVDRLQVPPVLSVLRQAMLLVVLCNSPVDSVSTLNELDGDQLLCFCVAGELHKTKAAVTEVCHLDIAGGFSQRVWVAGLHSSRTHVDCLLWTGSQNSTTTDQHQVHLYAQLKGTLRYWCPVTGRTRHTHCCFTGTVQACPVLQTAHKRLWYVYTHRSWERTSDI